MEGYFSPSTESSHRGSVSCSPPRDPAEASRRASSTAFRRSDSCARQEHDGHWPWWAFKSRHLVRRIGTLHPSPGHCGERHERQRRRGGRGGGIVSGKKGCKELPKESAPGTHSSFPIHPFTHPPIHLPTYMHIPHTTHPCTHTITRTHTSTHVHTHVHTTLTRTHTHAHT